MVKNKQCKAYYDVKDSQKRITILQGGTRSGKTYSVLLGLIEFAWKNQNKGLFITICRKTFPSLRASAMRDFFQILEKENLYLPHNHNKTQHIYELYGNTFEFISTDQPQKVRGRKREVLFMNEANEFTFEDYTQLAMRTTFKIILDYNPSDEFHWIYDKVVPREDADFFTSTYLDNPFLEESVIAEIEKLKELDSNYWRIYGLGERGVGESIIYTHWIYGERIPKTYDDIIYGIDFGYNAPTGMVRVYIKDTQCFVQEVLYKKHLTTTDLIQEMEKIVENKSKTIFGDSAEPKTITEISRAGFNIKSSDKSVKKGIDKLKSLTIVIDKKSVNLLKELKSYRWKQDKDGKTLDEPVKINDHLIDAMRYAIFTHLKSDNKITYWE